MLRPSKNKIFPSFSVRTTHWLIDVWKRITWKIQNTWKYVEKWLIDIWMHTAENEAFQVTRWPNFLRERSWEVSASRRATETIRPYIRRQSAEDTWGPASSSTDAPRLAARACIPRRLSTSRRGCGKLYRARSQLYRSQILQVNMHLKALAEIYTMHSFAQL